MIRLTIQHKFFISKKVSELINTNSYSLDNSVFDNVVEAISNTVSNTSDDTLIIALIFISNKEYSAINEVVSLYSKITFFHAYCLYIEDDSLEIPYDDFHVQNIWTSPITSLEVDFLIEKTLNTLETTYELKNDTDEYLARLLDMKQDQDNLINIGRSLSIEKNADRLLRLILKNSKLITGADAGSIYIIEEDDKSNKQIRFKFSHTFSKEVPLEEFVIPFDTTSIAGYTAVTGKVLNISDVYELSEKDPVEFNNSFDKANNYRSKSMLVIPMRSHTGEIIGVIQLINSKKKPNRRTSTGNEAYEVILENTQDFIEKVFPFEPKYEELMESIAGQAAIALENSRLFNQIQTQFEEFVKASVGAIESRDPATSGHSFRVADICKQIAHAINNTRRTPWNGISFSPTQLKELEYAALLHDFGKVYVELAIFQKSKKLFPKALENLKLKLDFLYRSVELQFMQKKNQRLITLEHDRVMENEVESLEYEMSNALDRISEIKTTLVNLNEPTPTDSDPAILVDNIRKEISDIDCMDISGKAVSIMTDEEIENLKIRKGSLNSKERKIIESHVVHTYNFVKRIPWPQEFRNIPEISLMHHEKLDGTGYPNGITEDKIPLQAKIMAIADMYDALTASDRPYKRAMSHNRALEILQCEAKENKIDADILELFESIDYTPEVQNEEVSV